MNTIDSLEALTELYDDVVPGALTKVVPQITPLYRQWIEASRFTIVSTVGEAGTDASPRGDTGPVVKLVDSKTLWLPDWRGNNRLDTLKNIVTDGRISLLFMVPGCNNVVRVNGTALLTADEAITSSFRLPGKNNNGPRDIAPRTVIVITVREAYFQCAKALMRSSLWSPDGAQDGDGQVKKVPTAGQFLSEIEEGFDVKAYDDGYSDYAAERMW